MSKICETFKNEANMKKDKMQPVDLNWKNDVGGEIEINPNANGKFLLTETPSNIIEVMSENETIYGDTLTVAEWWEPTSRLGFITGEDGQRKLHQLWNSSNGASEWREVPEIQV